MLRSLFLLTRKYVYAQYYVHSCGQMFGQCWPAEQTFHRPRHRARCFHGSGAGHVNSSDPVGWSTRRLSRGQWTIFNGAWLCLDTTTESSQQPCCSIGAVLDEYHVFLRCVGLGLYTVCECQGHVWCMHCMRTSCASNSKVTWLAVADI